MTGDMKYIRNMFGLLPVSDILLCVDCRLRGFLRKYYNCFSWANVIMHARAYWCFSLAFSSFFLCSLSVVCLLHVSVE